MLFLSARLITNKKIDLSYKALAATAVLSSAAQKTASFPASLPVISQPYKLSLSTAETIQKTTQLGITAIGIIKNIEEITTAALSQQEINIKANSQKLYKDTGWLYRQLSFLINRPEAKAFLSLLPPEEISDIRKKLLFIHKASEQLPDLLGYTKPAEYLVIFQNNMELRPTGGFIGSFGILTFQSGKLIDTQVYDVYQADGQLKGHIEPPEPIKNYLREANWFMRDANWDPDFQVTARRLQWYLDKTLDRQVNGVIAINLEVAKTLLKNTGPVFLPDFNDTIDENNIFHKIHTEIEEDFFPGSQKKATYLTALMRALLDKLKNVSIQQIPDLAMGFLDNLESKDIQLSLNQESLNNNIAVLGWAGEIKMQDCGSECVSITTGLNEANVGVNKANYFITRKGSVDLSLSKGQLIGKHTIILQNNAPEQNHSQDDIYKVYLRLLTPREVIVHQVSVEDGIKTTFSEPETFVSTNKKEAGTFVNIPPGKSKTITFTWSYQPDKPSPKSFRFILLKQSGVNPYPVTITLTKDTSLIYNQTLSEDIIRDFSW